MTKSRNKQNLLKAREYDQMSNDELKEHLKKLREAYISFQGRNQERSPKPLESTAVLRGTRISIARILTILNKRGIRA